MAMFFWDLWAARFINSAHKSLKKASRLGLQGQICILLVSISCHFSMRRLKPTFNCYHPFALFMFLPHGPAVAGQKSEKHHDNVENNKHRSTAAQISEDIAHWESEIARGGKGEPEADRDWRSLWSTMKDSVMPLLQKFSPYPNFR